MFGGASGSSDNYILRNDSFCFNQSNNTWYKLKPLTTPPTARAAHSACSDHQNNLFIFGGAVKNGALALDALFQMTLLENYNCEWKVVEVVGAGPGKRYGHAMVYNRPNIFLIGGNLGSTVTNEVYVLDLEDTTLMWKKLNVPGNIPCARSYHSAAVCKYGKADSMIILFGGRDVNNTPLNDTWGLRQHRNKTWDWVIT